MIFMRINVDIFTFIVNKVLYFLNFLDTILIGNLFSMLDLLLAFLIVSAFISLVLPISSKGSGVRGSQ